VLLMAEKNAVPAPDRLDGFPSCLPCPYP
jgi:hypothetical protein